jgi:hypothetical protein
MPRMYPIILKVDSLALAEFVKTSFCFIIVNAGCLILKREDIGFMSKPKLSDEEITQGGKEIYDSSIRLKVETPENIGKIISINVETGEYEIGDDLLVTSLRLRAKQADAALWSERIGFNAVYAVGGTLVRTNE